MSEDKNYVIQQVIDSVWDSLSFVSQTSETCRKKHRQPKLTNHTSSGPHMAYSIVAIAVMCRYILEQVHRLLYTNYKSPVSLKTNCTDFYNLAPGYILYAKII